MRKIGAMLACSLIAWWAGMYGTECALIGASMFAKVPAPPRGVLHAWTQIVGDLALIGSYVLMHRRWPDQDLFALRAPRAGAVAASSLAAGAAAYLAVVAMVAALDGAPRLDPAYDWRRATAVVFIACAVTAEEVLARCYLYALARKRLGPAPAVVISALLFALMDGVPISEGPLALLVRFQFGAVMSFLCLRFKTLLPAILVHAVFSYLTGLTVFDIHPPLDHPGVFVYEGSAAARRFELCELALGALVLLVLGRQIGRRAQADASAPGHPGGRTLP